MGVLFYYCSFDFSFFGFFKISISISCIFSRRCRSLSRVALNANRIHRHSLHLFFAKNKLLHCYPFDSPTDYKKDTSEEVPFFLCSP